MHILRLSRAAMIAAIESMTRELRDLKSTTMGEVEGLYEEIRKLKTSVACREARLDGYKVESQKQTEEITRLQAELSAMDDRLHSSQLEAMTLASQLEDIRRESADKRKIFRCKGWGKDWSLTVHDGRLCGKAYGYSTTRLARECLESTEWEEVDPPDNPSERS